MAARPLARASAVVVAALALAGCGGGGERHEPPQLELYDFEAHLAKAKSPQTFVVTCKQECPKTRYLFEGRPEITTDNVVAARADVDPSTGQAVVLVDFDARGRHAFREMTRREAQRGRRCRCAQHLAIVVRREILSLPFVDFARNPSGIPADNGVQFDMLSLREARELARKLNAP